MIYVQDIEDDLVIEIDIDHEDSGYNLFKKNSIKTDIYYSDLFMLFNFIAASFQGVVTKIIMGFVSGIITLTRMDQPILPDWIIKTLYIGCS